MKLYGIRLQNRFTGVVEEETFFATLPERQLYYVEKINKQENDVYDIDFAEMEVPYVNNPEIDEVWRSHFSIYYTSDGGIYE